MVTEYVVDSTMLVSDDGKYKRRSLGCMTVAIDEFSHHPQIRPEDIHVHGLTLDQLRELPGTWRRNEGEFGDVSYVKQVGGVNFYARGYEE